MAVFVLELEGEVDCLDVGRKLDGAGAAGNGVKARELARDAGRGERHGEYVLEGRLLLLLLLFLLFLLVPGAAGRAGW